MSLPDFQKKLRARFSKEACARVSFITAHTSKGHTFHSSFILQSSNFPLETALKDSNLVALAQEPYIEFVAYTRSTDQLIFLRNVNLSDGAEADTCMQTSSQTRCLCRPRTTTR